MYVALSMPSERYVIIFVILFSHVFDFFSVWKGKQNQIDRLLNQKAKPNKQESSSDIATNTDTQIQIQIHIHIHK